MVDCSATGREGFLASLGSLARSVVDACAALETLEGWTHIPPGAREAEALCEALESAEATLSLAREEWLRPQFLEVLIRLPPLVRFQVLEHLAVVRDSGGSALDELFRAGGPAEAGYQAILVANLGLLARLRLAERILQPDRVERTRAALAQ